MRLDTQLLSMESDSSQ